MSDTGNLDISENESVQTGHCIIVIGGGQMIYAGPLEGAPVEDGALVMVSPADFKRFSEAAARDKMH
jgi:hypothetical protein